MILSDLRKAVVDVAEFGVAQKRKRVMILGLSRKEYGENAEALLDKFYQQVLPSYKEGHAITLRDAIGDLPGLYLQKR